MLEKENCESALFQEKSAVLSAVKEMPEEPSSFPFLFVF